MPGSAQPSRREEFEIALICALPLEYDAVSLLFDRFWDENGDSYGRAVGDPNTYTTGRIGKYDVVLALLPHTGIHNAAGVAAGVRSSYTRLKLALLVGICGGVPKGVDGNETLLGDVVISKTIVHCDFGRRYPNKFVRKDTVEDNLVRANGDIRNLLATLETELGLERLQQRTAYHLRRLQNSAIQNKRRIKYSYPGTAEDKLFEPSYRHKHHSAPMCICRDCNNKSDPVCEEALSSSCSNLRCDEIYLLPRERLNEKRGLEQAGMIGVQDPAIHIGRIASGNTVMKSGEDRDNIAKENGVIAFEMEGAGIWDQVPCVVVKGISDYADCHKNKKWQHFAAASAAAAMKALLERYIQTDNPSYGKLQHDLGRRDGNPLNHPPIPPSTSQATLDASRKEVHKDGNTPDYYPIPSRASPAPFYSFRQQVRRDGNAPNYLSIPPYASRAAFDPSRKEDGVLRVEKRLTLNGHSASVEAVAFSPDSKVLASGSRDGKVKLWDGRTGSVLQTLTFTKLAHTMPPIFTTCIPPVLAVAFSPDSRLIASGLESKLILLWDSSTGEVLRTFDGHSASVRAVAFSSDGKVLASGSEDKMIKLWNSSTGEVLQTLGGHSASVRAVAFSPDGKMLASGSEDQTIKLWNRNTGAELRTLKEHLDSVNTVAFSPDGKVLLSGSGDKTSKLWDYLWPRTFDPGHSASVKAVAFSPDGKVLASGSEDKTIKLWDRNTGAELRTLEGHLDWVNAVAFSPDGKLLASGSSDMTVKLWEAHGPFGIGWNQDLLF